MRTIKLHNRCPYATFAMGHVATMVSAVRRKCWAVLHVGFPFIQVAWDIVRRKRKGVTIISDGIDWLVTFTEFFLYEVYTIPGWGWNQRQSCCILFQFWSVVPSIYTWFGRSEYFLVIDLSRIIRGVFNLAAHVQFFNAEHLVFSVLQLN